MGKVLNAGVNAVTELETLAVTERSKLLSLLSSLSDGVFMVDRNEQITAINHIAKAFLSLRQAAPSFDDILNSLPDSSRLREHIREAITYNQPIEEKDIPLPGRLLTITVKPVIDLADKTGHVSGVVVMIRDTSNEKSAYTMKEAFTDIIVHELRNPLTSIRGSAELLRTRTHLTADEKDRLLKIIEEQTGKLLSEVELILDAAKLQSGVFTIHKTHADLKELLFNLVNAYAPKAQERYVSFLTAIDPILPAFSFDPAYLRLALDNLLSNSLKFTSSGGTIKLSAKHNAGHVSISVSDTGAGIPKDKQHLLFSKFSQIHPPGTRTGTGIGLYLAKGIIQAHGGTIGFESEVGVGTTITCTLPVDIHTKSKGDSHTHHADSHSLLN